MSLCWSSRWCTGWRAILLLCRTWLCSIKVWNFLPFSKLLYVCPCSWMCDFFGFSLFPSCIITMLMGLLCHDTNYVVFVPPKVFLFSSVCRMWISSKCLVSNSLCHGTNYVLSYSVLICNIRQVLLSLYIVYIYYVCCPGGVAFFLTETELLLKMKHKSI